MMMISSFTHETTPQSVRSVRRYGCDFGRDGDLMHLLCVPHQAGVP
jgi:hypothetical protein